MAGLIKSAGGRPRPRLLHIGFGGFARAHTLAVIQAMNENMPPQCPAWGVRVARLHSSIRQLDALEKAGGCYSLVEADHRGAFARRVECILDTIHPLRDGPDALPEAIADPRLSTVTLTVTEKGYALSAEGLNLDAPEVQEDLNRSTWQSLPALLVEGLARRREVNAGGLTLISCDNLSENGRLLSRSVRDFARARGDASLVHWITENVAFPSSMVDRITPALDDAGRALIVKLTGTDDPNGIVTEPYLQWVIEDSFAGPRPPLDLGGAQFVTDIRPFEAMKLRMLNASHTMLAHLGSLAGLTTIDACMAEPLLARAAARLMRIEAAPTLPPLPGIDLDAYAGALLTRFANPRLRHACVQIASDTSQKLPQRLLAPISWHLDNGSVWPLMALAIAGWMAWARGQDEMGRTLPLNDPLAKRIRKAASGPDGDAHVAAMLEIEEIFSSRMAKDPRFFDPIRSAYRSLRERGVRGALADISPVEGRNST